MVAFVLVSIAYIFPEGDPMYRTVFSPVRMIAGGSMNPSGSIAVSYTHLKEKETDTSIQGLEIPQLLRWKEAVSYTHLELNVGIHIHVSETEKQIKDSITQYGKTPFAILLSLIHI